MKKAGIRLKNTRGAALIVIILVMTMLSGIGAGILNATASNTREAVNDKQYKTAFYDGEAAVNVALDALKKGVDKVYNGMKSRDETTMDPEDFMDEAIANATAALPAAIAGKVAYEGFSPAAVTNGYVAGGLIKFSDPSLTMNRRVGADVTVKIMPLIRTGSVNNVLGTYDFTDNSAILSGGDFYTGGHKYEIYGGYISVNEDGDNDTLLSASKHKGDGSVIQINMSDFEWLNIAFWDDINRGAVASSDKLEFNSLTVGPAEGNTYKGKMVFVNGDLNFNLGSGGTTTNLYETVFFVGGSTTVTLAGSSKPFNNAKNGFNNCMIFSDGSITMTGKPDNLYEKDTPSDAMYMYTNGDFSFTGGNSQDVLNAVIYANGNVDIQTQVHIEGQIVTQNSFNYLAGSNPIVDATYNKGWVSSFYKKIAEGMAGLVPSNYAEVVDPDAGVALIDPANRPYVTGSRIRQLSGAE